MNPRKAMGRRNISPRICGAKKAGRPKNNLGCRDPKPSHRPVPAIGVFPDRWQAEPLGDA